MLGGELLVRVGPTLLDLRYVVTVLMDDGEREAIPTMLSRTHLLDWVDRWSVLEGERKKSPNQRRQEHSKHAFYTFT